MNKEHCVCCGSEIPEGRQHCIICGYKAKKKQTNYDRTMKYNKLVRDKIPEIIRKSGKVPFYTIKKDFRLLEQKLNEEVAEYHESKSVEELADILEVVFALCKASGCSVLKLYKTYLKKHFERGSFSKGIFLKGVEEWAQND